MSLRYFVSVNSILGICAGSLRPTSHLRFYCTILSRNFIAQQNRNVQLRMLQPQQIA